MNEQALYNSRITKTYLAYIEKYHPEINVYDLLRHAHMTSAQVHDSSCWFTQSQVERFWHYIVEKTGDQDISRKVGKFSASSNALGAIKQLVIGMVNPRVAYFALQKLYPKLSRTANTTVKRLGRQKLEITTFFKSDVQEKPYQCLNRVGFLEAIAKPFTGDYARVEHPECIHRGGRHCRYIVNWATPLSQKLLILTLILLVLSLVISVTALLTLPLNEAHPIFLGLVFLVMGCGLLTLRRKNIELSQTIENQGNAANELLDEVNERYNNALAIQEIGLAITATLDADGITASFMDVMRKRLRYDRGFILLFDAAREQLQYSAQFGFSGETLDFIKKARVRVHRLNVHDILKTTLVEHKPFLAPDFKALKSSYSKGLQAFLTKLGTESAIAVPIVYENESLGLLAVDNIQSKRPLTQTDISLLMGVALEIAVSLNNVATLQKKIEGEERYRLLVENMPIGLLVIDTHMKIINANSKAADILGRSAESLLGINLSDALETMDVHHADQFKQCLEENITTRHQLDSFNIRGRSMNLYLQCTPFYDSSGRLNGVQVLMEDITALKQMEAQLRQKYKMESMGTLAGGIAHDFNNILSSIIGFTELALRNQPPESPTHRHLSHVLSSSARAKDLVKQILLFTQQTELTLKPLHLGQCINDILPLIRASIPKHIDIKTSLDSSATIMSDTTQIHQIMMNLVSNASFAMRENGGELKIRLEDTVIDDEDTAQLPQAPKGEYVRMSVSDTGIGISTEDLDRIFDPFFTTKTREEGVGMGLSVVHGIITSQNGFIVADSAPNQGATFKLYWPRLETVHDESRTIQQDIAGGQEHILFVDDESSIVELAEEMLNLLGYQVTIYSDSQAALTYFKQHHADIDLVITDMVMPGLTGDKLAREMFDVNPNINIVLLTGYSDKMTFQTAKAMGIHQIIHKPLDMSVLGETVRKALDHV